MNDLQKTALAQRFAGLNHDKQQTFLHLLKAQGINFAQLPIVPQQRGAQSGLSFSQARQWFLWHLEPDSSAYHIAGALALDGALDVDAVRASFAALVARHEALRTVFRDGDDGSATQEVLAEAQPDFRLIDVSDAAAQAAANALADEVFDLRSGPLLRVGLIRLAPERHVLVVVMHHIVSDGWSMDVVVREFAAAYRGAVLGEAAALAPLPIQYPDYALWQRSWLEAGERERQLAYWREQLGGEQPVLQLNTDHPRRADGRYRAARVRLSVPVELALGLGKRAGAHGATPFMALLTAWQVLLQRYSGLKDIRVGVPIANRHRTETEGLVGFFVNTQVLRNTLSGDTTLEQALLQTKAASLGAQAHQDLPFEQLVEALQVARTLGQNPLFQVMFNHQRAQGDALQHLPGLTLGEYTLGEPAAQFELSLGAIEQRDGRVDLVLTYAAELFDAATMERMAQHYLAVLKQLAEAPHQTIAGLTLLAEPEVRHLLGWGGNAKRFDSAEPVHRVIEAQAARAPDATALLFGDEALSYGDLNARANQLAHHLAGQGVGPEVKVGIALERSVEMVVSLLGVMKAGGAYVPLDPDYPTERLAYMVEDSGIALLLTHSTLKSRMAHERTITLDTLDLSGHPTHNPEVALDGENLAYVIYTSGSTGRPKGAANRHRSLYNRLAWMQQAYGLSAADTVLQKTPFSFDVSVWEFFWPLMYGARLALAQPGEHREPAKLVSLIRSAQVTTLHFVPSMLQAFVAHDGIGACESIRRVVCSGEALPAEAQAQLLAQLPQARLYNLYGPTEAAIDVTHFTCDGDVSRGVPIGAPIADTQTHVLDSAMNLVPQGVAGELYLGGVGLARGYLNRPGLTSERFVADPFGVDGARLYRTGDLVRWRADGQLEYLGRLDHQVKIRGFRIELGEIEAQLLAQAGVRESVVVAQQGPGGMRLVGYAAGDALDAAQLKAALAAVLPDYMVPGVVVTLASMPLNPNGKLDRKALPAPEQAVVGYEAPQGEAEQALARIWAEVLGLERVGRVDNFFELGGHSLKAMEVVAAIRQRHQLTVPIRTFFEFAVLRDFAAQLEGEFAKGAATAADKLSLIDSLLAEFES